MSAGGFFIQRGNSPQRSISIMLRGDSDSCSNDEAPKMLAMAKMVITMMTMPMTMMRMVVATTLAALLVSVIEATRTTTTTMKTTMTATTQQFNGTRIREGTAMGTTMMMMSATRR